MTSSYQHLLLKPGLMRVFVNSDAVSEKDLFELALTNKAIYREVLQERLCYRIKNISFTDPENPIHQAIILDRPDFLEDALQLGEFEPREQAMTSPNGGLLMDTTASAAHDLLQLCLYAGSYHCLSHLLHLGDTRGTPYRYGHEWLYDAACDVALTTGKLHCLFYLHDHAHHTHGFHLPDPTPLYHTLLQRARSPATIRWLADRMPPSTNYRALLTAHCADPHSQPAAIHAITQLIPKPERDRLAPALCAAASITHLAALDILLRRGRAKAYAACRQAREPRSSAHFNPLFCALTLPLPGRPSRAVFREFPSEGESGDRAEWEGVRDGRVRRLLQLRMTWRDRVRRVFEAVRVVVWYLGVEAVGDEFRGRGEWAVRDEMKDCAAVIYLFQLRAYFLGNLPWLLEYKPALLDELLVPVQEGRSTARTVWSTAGFISAAIGGHGDRIGASPDEEGEELVGLGQAKPAYSWRKGTTGKRAMAVTRAERVGMTEQMVYIWKVLLTPTTVGMAQRYLKIRAEEVAELKPTALLWHLLVAEERKLPFEVQLEESNQWDWKFVSK